MANEYDVATRRGGGPRAARPDGPHPDGRRDPLRPAPGRLHRRDVERQPAHRPGRWHLVSRGRHCHRLGGVAGAADLPGPRGLVAGARVAGAEDARPGVRPAGRRGAGGSCNAVVVRRWQCVRARGQADGRCRDSGRGARAVGPSGRGGGVDACSASCRGAAARHSLVAGRAAPRVGGAVAADLRLEPRAAAGRWSPAGVDPLDLPGLAAPPARGRHFCGSSGCGARRHCRRDPQRDRPGGARICRARFGAVRGQRGEGAGDRRRTARSGPGPARVGVRGARRTYGGAAPGPTAPGTLDSRAARGRPAAPAGRSPRANGFARASRATRAGFPARAGCVGRATGAVGSRSRARRSQLGGGTKRRRRGRRVTGRGHRWRSTQRPHRRRPPPGSS